MTIPINTTRSGLARSLAAAGLLSSAELDQVQDLARQEGKPLSTMLVDRQLLSSPELARFCEQEYGQPLLDLDDFDLEQLPPQFLSMDLIERHHAIPVKLDNRVLYLAMSDPTHVAALEDFGFRFNLVTDTLLVEEDKLQQLLLRLQQSGGTGLDLDGIADDDIAGLELDQDPSEREDQFDHNEDDAPIVRYINKIMLDAVRKEASDLHFEPFERFFRIRFRIDGMLHEVASPPVHLASRFAARLKVMARLDIAERRLPQDGRIKLKLTRSRSVDMRVNTLPTMWGEKVVIRLLDSSAARLDIDQLGYSEEQKALYLHALRRPQGMILVTGPTGSGKTVSLYTGLSILNTVTANIATAEDPVEINLPGINQVQINPKAGLSFAHALRAFLRQDPDIIMVGEIRDLETAEISVKAAQTGHLVLSTLHTNSAAETLTRLGNMGLPAYNIASSVSLIMAQRLARKLCLHCRTPELLPTEQLTRLGFTPAQLADGMTLYRAVGCAHCTEGYKGRIGVYEVMAMSERLAQLIMENAGSLALARAAEEEGMVPLRQAALDKARRGIISLAEVNRITG
ncbi:type IV-A pilus assembly ATPase PilB [Oceanimonas sp. GK1]|uniref:type IV-A pilus assembly ATPase PilB n=1 Tax=Oceanimonas sp. (strain GK1 / IBRC-M 10197) TaxID=511062 RepID=UPI0002495341|nr:type IV-A pilus assembly ATPase PilB [Oceanimonas sp. GK1]AEY02828.1 type IV-A pilus assembly ATPase PilB [Oceanimonas sp. GK1]